MGKAFVAKLAREGARDPQALAAWIGRKKHGKAFGKLAAKDSGGKSSGPKNGAGAKRQATVDRLNSGGGDDRRTEMSREEKRLVAATAERFATDPSSLRSERSQGHDDESKAKSRTEVLRARAIKQAIELRRRRFGET
ncbi:hypothetical protein ACFQ67_00165 [Streptomyces sp. NPDC056488]|uniref:hypothetical protein n=1 Tax=Streptomyces sp. NPDC056488 TaxID=3345836 RepID=UPI00369942D4